MGAKLDANWEGPMDKVVHFEIPFDDKKRAMKFYADAFDWKLMDMGEMNYVMAETVATNEKRMPSEPGAINGGLFQRPKEAPHPVIYLGVASLDQTIKKVQAGGGKVVTPKTPIPGMGAYARVTDTEGNVVGLFENG
jgi:predicted enzyme related to lactoylglutathione lyase